MNIQLLEEPELEFGNSGRHVDIRFGIKAHGPVSIEDPQAPKEIKLGIVGTAATIEKLTTWLDAGRNPIPAKESKKPNLFPSFPGFAPDRCFYRSEEHTSELQSLRHLVCRLLLEKK